MTHPGGAPESPVVRRLAGVGLVALCLGWLALALSLVGVVSQSPRLAQVFMSDDGVVAAGVVHMLVHHTLDYVITAYPGLYFNLAAIGTFVVAHLGVNLPHAAMLVTRTLSAVAGAVTLLLTGLLARQLCGRWLAGLVAAALVATTPKLFLYGVVAHPDTLQTALMVGSLLLVLRYVAQGRLRDLVGASAVAGLAFAAKYGGAFLAPAVAAAVVVVALRRSGRRARLAQLWRRGALAPAVFLASALLGHPGFLVRPRAYVWAIHNQAAWERWGMFFRETRSTLTWLVMLGGRQGLGPVSASVFLAFPAFFVWLWWRRRRSTIPEGRLFGYAATASVGGLCLLLLLTGMRTFAPRYLFPCLPFVAAFSAAALFEVALALPRPRGRLAGLAVVAVWAAIAVATRAPALAAEAGARRASGRSPKIAVGRWLVRHVPSGTPLLFDAYTYVPESMTGAVRTWGLRPSELARVRPQLIITNAEIRNRFADPAKAAACRWGARMFMRIHHDYSALAAGDLDGFRLVARFPAGDVRVYAAGALADRLAGRTPP